jgi:hypothetical protein
MTFKALVNDAQVIFEPTGGQPLAARISDRPSMGRAGPDEFTRLLNISLGALVEQSQRRFHRESALC